MTVPVGGAGEEAGCSAPPLSLPPSLPSCGRPHSCPGELWAGPHFPICPPHTDAPSISAVNAVVLAAVGEEALLACEASGVPPPRVIWYRGTWGRVGPADCPTGAVKDQFSRTVFRGCSEWGVWGERPFPAAPTSPTSPTPASTQPMQPSAVVVGRT